MRVPPVVVLAGALAISAVGARVDPVRQRSAALRVAGALLATGGLAVALAGVAAFRRQRTTVDPRHPERASALVTDGVYRWTRNPMYVGFVGVALGGASALGSPLGVLGPAFLSLYLDRVQIPAEEAALRSHFGLGFDAYTRTVGRWLGRPGPGRAPFWGRDPRRGSRGHTEDPTQGSVFPR